MTLVRWARMNNTLTCWHREDAAHPNMTLCGAPVRQHRVQRQPEPDVLLPGVCDKCAGKASPGQSFKPPYGKFRRRPVTAEGIAAAVRAFQRGGGEIQRLAPQVGLLWEPEAADPALDVDGTLGHRIGGRG